MCMPFNWPKQASTGTAWEKTSSLEKWLEDTLLLQGGWGSGLGTVVHLVPEGCHLLALLVYHKLHCHCLLFLLQVLGGVFVVLAFSLPVTAH